MSTLDPTPQAVTPIWTPADYTQTVDAAAQAIVDAQAPAEIHYLGICDECRTVKAFATPRARQLWLNNHPHQES